jgi:hypothetical protein
MLENSIEPAPLTPATQTNIELAEGHVREGEERVATQLALIEKLDADGHHEQSRNEGELLESLTKRLCVTRRNLQNIRDARKPQGQSN